MALVMVLASACAHRTTNRDRNPAAHAEYQRYGDAQRRATANMLDRGVALECKPHPAPDRCGLLYDGVFADDAVGRFIVKVCKEDLSTLAEASRRCRDRHLQMFLARLALRYDAIDEHQLQLHCDANPLACQNLRRVEIWMLKAHNRVVLDDYRSDMRRARLEHDDRMVDARDREEARAKERRIESGRDFGGVVSVLGAIFGGAPCVSDETGEATSATDC